MILLFGSKCCTQFSSRLRVVLKCFNLQQFKNNAIVDSYKVTVQKNSTLLIFSV